MISPRPSLFDHVTRRRIVALFGAVAALCLVARYDGISPATWYRTGRWREPLPTVPAWQLQTAREWFQQAQARAATGSFRMALITAEYALACDPDDAAMLNFKGNMLESMFRFPEAQEAYEHVLRVDANNANARQNLVFCQRINRYQQDGALHPSTLYGLHRVMLDQGRTSEDLAIGRRLDSDRNLWQTAWQAALDRTGLQGTITVDADGAMGLDLTGSRQPDLSLIREFPVTSLNLSHTGLANVRQLRGLPLRKLDLTQTVVDDLSPLRGMPLQVLRIARTGVVNLAPLAGCPLRELDISGTRTFDLAPLARLPLTRLWASDTPINDLRHLAALPLVELHASRTRVSDLRPLSHLPLEILALDATLVSDLAPLKGSQLQELYLAATRVRDLAPLSGMPLRVVVLTGCARARDLRPLASCRELEHLLMPPNGQFAERLAGLPRLRFLQPAKTSLEDRLLITDGTEDDASPSVGPEFTSGMVANVEYPRPDPATRRARARRTR